MHVPVAQGEDKHVQVLTDESQNLEAPLGVNLAGVLDNQRGAPVKFCGQAERYAALGEVRSFLGGS